MSTNFYLKAKPRCEHCGRGPSEGLHIGKSSHGWAFALHVRGPDDPTNEGYGAPVLPSDLDGWIKLFHQYGVMDEYGGDVTTEEMTSIITERFRRSESLRRHGIDQVHCIGHGSGSYDFMIGAFS